MNIIDRVIAGLDRANLTFGFREAAVLALAGVAIAAIVAYRYVG